MVIPAECDFKRGDFVLAAGRQHDPLKILVEVYNSMVLLLFT